MDANTRNRLEAAGIDPTHIDDPHAAWLLLFDHFGRRATVTDRYAIEAAARHLRPHDLSVGDRERLSREVLQTQFPGIELVGETSKTPVEVLPYDPRWPLQFARWNRRLSSVLPATTPVRHVGSTAVPGLVAKPIVDIQISVGDIGEESAYQGGIESLGLPLQSRDPRHRYFRPPAGSPRTVHVHVCGIGSSWESDHLLFRDFLRSTPEASDRYGALKMRLAQQYRNDRLAYTDAKTEFILATMDDARMWAEKTSWTIPPA